MTLILAYRNKYETIFISDFRLTIRENKNKKHYDKTLKFLSFSERIGLFLAGDVNFWIKALPKIQSISDKVTYDNFLDVGAPLHDALSELAIKHKGNRAGALGFLIDTTIHKNKTIQINIEPENGCLINALPNEKTFIIGSGNMIPGLSNYIDNTFSQTKKFYNDDLYGIASTIRHQIIAKLKQSGHSSFKRLGISPVMGIALLDSDYFKICGEEIEGSSITTSGFTLHKYSFNKNEDGNIIIEDAYNSKIIEIVEISELKNLIGNDNEIFDPENLTRIYDPAEEFQNSEYVFHFHQTKFPPITKKQKYYRIVRQFYRIDFVTKARLCKSKLLNTQVLENLAKDEYEKYILNGDYYVENNSNNEPTIETLKNDLFNHKLLSDYWAEYNNKIYTN